MAEYELEEMCIQLEKEDILCIYLHNPRDMGLLTITEQENIISQADAHLKRAKGKAMLPRLTKDDVIAIFDVSFIYLACLILMCLRFHIPSTITELAPGRKWNAELP